MAWRALPAIYFSCLLLTATSAQGALAYPDMSMAVGAPVRCESVFSDLDTYLDHSNVTVDYAKQSKRLEIMRFMAKVRLMWGRETDFTNNPRSVDADMFRINNVYGMPRGRFIVMRNQFGEIVTTGAITKVDAETCELRKWYADPDKAPKGLGTAVFQDLVRTARQIGCHRIVAKTHSDAKAALAKYEKLNFVRIPFVRNPHSDSTADIAFSLDLNH